MFHFPAAWISTGLAAASITFGPVPVTPQVAYAVLPGRYIGMALPPALVVIGDRPRAFWTRHRALCVLAHEYGHLAGRRHSPNPRSIMYPVLTRDNCRRYIRRRGLAAPPAPLKARLDF
jgi:hypothetical protein